MEASIKKLEVALKGELPRGLVSTHLAAVERFGLRVSELNLAGGSTSDADLLVLAAALAEGRVLVEAIDLRRNSLTLTGLLSLCTALEQGITNHRTAQPPHLSALAPCWMQLGNNPEFTASDAASALFSRRLCCISLRCSRSRCLYGAVIHLRCKLHSGKWPTPTYPVSAGNTMVKGSASSKIPMTMVASMASKPAASNVTGMLTGHKRVPESMRSSVPSPSAPTLALKPNPPDPTPAHPHSTRLQASARKLATPQGSVPVPAHKVASWVDNVPLIPPLPTATPHGGSPHLFTVADSPLTPPTMHVDLRRCRQAFAICPITAEGAAGNPPFQVEAFEEFEVLAAAPLSILGTGCAHVRRTRPPYEVGYVPAWDLTGDVCDEHAFNLLRKAEDVHGFCSFVDRAVERLGGNVIEKELRYNFAKNCMESETFSFQSLLTALHNRLARNNAGIRMPTDFYAIREYYNVYGIPDEKGTFAGSARNA